MNRRKTFRSFVYFCLILILVRVMLYSGLRILESTVLHSGSGETEQYQSRTIVRDGVQYYPRQDITVVMVLGIDESGPMESSGSYMNKGAADVVLLAVFDEADQTCDVLQLNRDTMLQMPVLGLGGRKAGTFFGQLALSHTYGTGLADSCENTMESVSEYLGGITIDHYVAMNMDAIAIMNDAVGGVTVEVTDDFSQVDPTIGKGLVTLNGQQATHFVRSRQGVGDQLNVSRMARHREYAMGFLEAFRAAWKSSAGFLAETYETMLPYMVTDCTVNTISGFLDRYGEYTVNPPVTPAGESVMGEEFYEFYADEAQLDALILDLFFAPKQ